VALGIMSRFAFFITLILISTQSFGLSIVCTYAKSDEERVQFLNNNFNNSEVVVQLGFPIPTESSTTKHEVLRVWKGTVGEYIYVHGGAKSGLLFTSRINGNGPLKSLGHNPCSKRSSRAFKISTLKLLKQNHGAGYLPMPNLIEPKYIPNYLNWFFMFGFVLLVVISMIIYNFVQYKENVRRKMPNKAFKRT
jgi:hypothetical protein